MLRGIWGDKARYKETYWSEFKGMYFAGDGARRDKDGYFWIVGRIDDVLNVAGHRLGTAEVESALVSHPSVAEAAVVGRPDELKGQAVVCFVTVKTGIKTSKELAAELKKHVRTVIGPVATPDEIRFTDALPKTRSGKIMRRLLKQIAAGETIKGDTTTLEDLSVLAKLAHGGGLRGRLAARIAIRPGGCGPLTIAMQIDARELRDFVLPPGRRASSQRQTPGR